MTERIQKGTDVTSRHDVLFKAVCGKPETTRRFLEACLPEEVLHHVDLSILIICKDSFVAVAGPGFGAYPDYNSGNNHHCHIRGGKYGNLKKLVSFQLSLFSQSFTYRL